MNWLCERTGWSGCLFGVILLFTLSSCGMFDSSRGEIKPIEGKIFFTVHEEYSDYSAVEVPKIVLSLVSEKIYPCYNWRIESTIDVRENKVVVAIVGIYVPDICATAFGPATSRAFFKIPQGSVSLIFSYNGITDQYALVVTDSVINVYEEEVPRYTEPRIRVMWRYPPNSMVYLCGTTVETSWMCEDFLGILLNSIGFEEFRFPDTGEIPYPHSSAGYYYDMPAKYFRYETEEKFDKAGELLKSYAGTIMVQKPGTGIALINWKNKAFLSWVLQSSKD